MIEKRYYNFSSYLKKEFGKKVWKISINANFTCPNRDGKVGHNGCIYCNNKSFNSNISKEITTVETQISDILNIYKKRKKADAYLAYFQTYTNTYAPIEILKKYYDAAAQFDEIVGLAIGTRPDCINDEILDLIESYTERLAVWLEYGLQTIHNTTLKKINRGHSCEDFLNAIQKTQNRNISICVHIIIGLPGETKHHYIETIKALSKLKINGIKFHPLHVLKDTALEKLHFNKEVNILSQQEYVEIICDCLELLPPDVVIQRLTGDAPKDLLIAPNWCSRKNETLQMIDKELERRDTRQGAKWQL